MTSTTLFSQRAASTAIEISCCGSICIGHHQLISMASWPVAGR